MMDDRNNRIRELAYFFWREEGCPEGQEDRHWRKAQQIIEQKDGEAAERKIVEGEPPGETPTDDLPPFHEAPFEGMIAPFDR